MNVDRSTERMSAICVPADVEVWAAESSYTQAGPRAGVPVPAQDSTMALMARGSQSAAGSIVVQTNRGGFPGQHEAEFIWKNTSDASTLWRGWDVPQVLTGWEAPIWTDGSGGPQSTEDPCALTLDSGVVLVALQVRDTTYTGTTGEYRVEVLSRSIVGVWSRVLVYGQDSSPSQDYLPALVLLPSGRILLYHLRVDTGASTATLTMWYSDDSGATWSYGGEMLDATGAISLASVTPTRIRAAYRDGQIALLVSVEYLGGATTIANRIMQYASSDLGNSFDYLGEYTPEIADGTDHAAGYTEIVATDLGFCVAYLANTSITRILLADAYQLLTDGDPADLVSPATLMTGGGTGTSVISDGDLAMMADDAGVLYLYARVITSGEGLVFASRNHGDTWDGMGASIAYGGSGYWQNSGVSADCPVDFCAAFALGRGLVIGNWRASTGNEDNSLGCWYVGGYTTVPARELLIARTPSDRAAWEITWVPIEEPQDNGWTAAGTAATEDLVTPGRHQLSVTAANTRTYTQVPAASPSTGLVACVEVLTSAGSTSTNRVALRLRYSDGVVGYGVDIRFGATGYGVYDSTSGAQIGSTQTVATSSGVEVLVAMYGDEVSVWHRLRSVVGSKNWTAGPTSTALSDAGAVTDYVTFGVCATSATDDTTYWYRVCYGYGARVGQPLTRASFPTDLLGRNYSARYSYVNDDVRIAAADGPTWIGDQWTIATRYDYELRRAFDVPCPRIRWRSTSTAAQVIAFSFRGSTTEDTYGDSDILAIPVLGANISQITVALYDADTSAWISQGTINLCTGLDNLRANTVGIVATPDSTITTNRPYLRAGEFDGATFRIDGTWSRRITRQLEGGWRPRSYGPLQARLVLEDATGAETASTASSAIIPKDSVILVPLAGTRWSGVRLSIVAAAGAVPQPAESYWEAGWIRPMWLRPIPRHPDWGRAQGLEAAAEVVETRDRVRVGRELAPARRTLDISWMDGVDQAEIEDLDNGQPDYAAIGGEAVSWGGLGHQLSAILREVSGAGDVVLYLPRIPIFGSPLVINRRARLMLARITSPIQIETAQGEQEYDEMVRIASVSLSEEV